MLLLFLDEFPDRPEVLLEPRSRFGKAVFDRSVGATQHLPLDEPHGLEGLQRACGIGAEAYELHDLRVLHGSLAQGVKNLGRSRQG